jgi:hypothetical protein
MPITDIVAAYAHRHLDHLARVHAVCDVVVVVDRQDDVVGRHLTEKNICYYQESNRVVKFIN